MQVFKEDFPFDEVRDPDGNYFDSIEDAKKHTGLSEEHIWSVVEFDEGDGLSYGPSHHYVNLIGYTVTEEKHDGETYYEYAFEFDDDLGDDLDDENTIRF